MLNKNLLIKIKGAARFEQFLLFNMMPEEHMRLAIVDDESVYRSHIVEMINSVYGKSDVSCYLYSDGSELIRSFENGLHFRNYSR